MTRYTDLEQVSSAVGETSGPELEPMGAPTAAGGHQRRIWGGLAAAALLAAAGAAGFFSLKVYSAVEFAAPPTEDLASLAADFASAKEFPNIHLVASGYNIFYSDPTPKIDLGSDVVNVDPGLRKPVFKIGYGEKRLTGDRRHRRPDGYFATVDYGCSEVFSTKTISDDYGLSTERNLEASITYTQDSPTTNEFDFKHVDGGATSFGRRSFVGSLSGSYQQVSSTNLFKDSRMVQSSAKCAVYTAGIAYGFPPEINPDFKAKVDIASGSGGWFEVFDEFGTHFLSNVKMGARFGSMMIFKKDHYDAMTSEVASAGLEVGRVIEAGVKTMVSYPKIEDMLSFEFSPSLQMPGVPLVNQQSVEKVTSHASAQVFQGVGPQMPPGGASKWIDKVTKSPVPMRFSKMEICAHPGLSSSQRSKCAEALEVYCEQHLKAKGAICEPPDKRECQMDADCQQGYVCRSFKCEAVPICYVSLYDDKWYKGGEYVLDPVNAIEHPNGKSISLRLDGWHDRVSSIQLGKGCKQIKVYDDDAGGVFDGWPENKVFTTTQGMLDADLNDDISMIEIWANDVPGTPPFEPSQGEAPSNLPSPEKITFDPAKDTLFAEPQTSQGLNVPEDEEFFANIGKAMYGYNHFHGSPFSTMYAGSDPGFQGRAVWKVAYDAGNVGKQAMWRRMPMAPNARYFVLFAQKHPQVKQIQVDAQDPTGTAIRYLTARKEELEKCIQKIKDGKLEYYDWKHNVNGHAFSEERMTQPELPVPDVTEEFCALQQSCKDLRQEMLDTGTEHFREQEDQVMADYNEFMANYAPYYGSYYDDHRRQLGAVAELHHEGRRRELAPVRRRLRAVGARFCQDGKVYTWTKEDKDKQEQKEQNEKEELEKFEKALLAYENYDYDYFYQDDRRLYDWYGGGGGNRRLEEEEEIDWDAPWYDDLFPTEEEIDGSMWYSVKDKPNIREFGSLAKAKQALRSEARCIGSFGGEPCPSGADYDISIDGTTWDTDRTNRYVDWLYEKAVTRKLKKEWPHFIVKVTNDNVSGFEVDLIDGQDQRKQWRTGFDSIFPHDREKMLDFLKEHVAANPSDGQLMEAETEIATKVPDGWKVTLSQGGAYCEQDMKTDTVTDAHSYEKLTSSSTGPPGGQVFSFGLSYEKKELLKNQGRKGEKMVATQAECGAYYAQLVDLQGSPPETEPSLAFLAGKAEEDADFWIIFDQYGLHFPTELVFGARYGTSQFIRESNFMEYQRTEETLSLEFSAQVTMPTQEPGVDVQSSRDVSIGYSGTDEEKRVVDKYFEERRVFSIGKRIPEGGLDAWAADIGGEPMPIKFGLMSLCDHPAFKDKAAKCAGASSSYCEKHLKRLHPEVECGKTKRNECLWDTDCEGHPNVRCTHGMCSTKPKCEVQIFKETYFKGDSHVLGPVFYHPHKPYEIVDLAHVDGGSFGGKVRSLKMTGGCSKVVKMSSLDLNGGDNFALTNHKANDGTELVNVGGVNYIAMYPKQFFVDEDSEWFKSKH